MNEVGRAKHSDRMKRYVQRVKRKRYGVQVNHRLARAVAEGVEADPEDCEPLAAILRAEARASIPRMLGERLTRRQRTIVEMQFGLRRRRPRTLRETGLELGLTAEAVRLILGKALERLRYDTEGRQWDSDTP